MLLPIAQFNQTQNLILTGLWDLKINGVSRKGVTYEQNILLIFIIYLSYLAGRAPAAECRYPPWKFCCRLATLNVWVLLCLKILKPLKTIQPMLVHCFLYCFKHVVAILILWFQCSRSDLCLSTFMKTSLFCGFSTFMKTSLFCGFFKYPP